MPLFFTFRDWFRQIGKKALSGYLVDHCHLRQAVLRDSVRLMLLVFVSYRTFSLLIFRKVFEPNRRVTVERDPMFVAVL